MFLISPFIIAHDDTPTPDASDGASPIAFPIWTYYAEIALHVLTLIASIAVAFFIRFNLYKSQKHSKGALRFAFFGFLFIAAGELLTTIHHFLISPFGIYDSIANHFLLLIGLVLLVLSFYSSR